MDQAELAFLDGTHPALAGNSTTPRSPRSSSPPTRSSRSSTSPSSPQFSAIDQEIIEEQRNGTAVEIPTLRPRAGNGGASNTGPKGVIADWKMSRENPVSSEGEGVAAPLIAALLDLDLHHRSTPEEIRQGTLDEEERARETYRRKRIEEMRGSGERVVTGKVFGHLREIGLHQFLGAVEDDSGIAVVIHLYEPSFEDCEILNYHLTSIARAYPYTKFLRALAAEMDYATDLEEAALPTLLVYRNGELETSLVGINREWGNGTREEIMAILIKNRTLSSVPTIPFEGRKGPTLAGRDSSGEDSD